MIERETLAYAIIAVLTVAALIASAVWQRRRRRHALRMRGIKTHEPYHRRGG